MSLSLKDYQSNIEIGLGTFTYSVPSTGIYYISVVSSVLPPSGLSIVVSQNGSQIGASASPSSAEQIVSCLLQSVSCASGDSIQVVLSSSNSNDQMLNTVKTLISINLANT